MTTSRYMPDVEVWVAWDGGFRVPRADWTWTDVSDYVELADGINITWGRGDERSTADANTLTLTFDNSDGRFTAGRSTSPYFPDVKLYRPIRVLGTPVDGAETILFTGYITSWPTEWEATGAYAKTTISASSRLARLGLNAQWRSLVEEAILGKSPVAYYPLGEPEGATRADDVSGRAAEPLTLFGDSSLPMTFGQATGPGTDDLTAASFVSGQYLRGTLSQLDVVPAVVWLSAFVLTTQSDVGIVGGLSRAGGGLGSVTLRVRSDGTADANVLPVGGGLGGTAQSAGIVNDGRTHHLLARVDWSAHQVDLYVDGDLEATSVSMDPGPFWSGATVMDSGLALTGTVAHLAFGTTDITADQVAHIAAAGVDGFAGETTDVRFERYAEMAGIPGTEVNVEPGSTTMVHVDTTGQNVVDMLRIVEATEAGVLFDALDGTLTLHARSHRYTSSATVVLDMAKNEVEAGYSPRLDPTGLANDITVTGTVPAHVVDENSRDAYGVATASMTTASEDSTEPLNLASWAKFQYAEPKPRTPALSVSATGQAAFYAEGESSVSSADLIALTIGDKITVANHPQQAALSLIDYFVEGGSFSIGHERFDITWNLSPTDSEDRVFVLDSVTQGVLDTNVLAL